MADPEVASPKLRVEGAETAGAAQLVGELQAMVDNPDLSDLCLLCKDGVKVHACRMLLMARSHVLRKMLSNGMAESRMSQINLPDITSSALLPTLEFLYTGAIIRHEMELGTAFLVFHAANFLHLPALEALLKPLLRTSIVSASNAPALLAQHLSTLESYGIMHLLDEVVNSILSSLRRHCCAACPTAFLQNLSNEVMHILFQSLKVRIWPSTVFSFVEYIRMRSLLLWGATHISSEAEAFLERALPPENLLALHFAALRSSGKSYLEVGLERESAGGQLLTAKELKHIKDVQEFLGNISWTRQKIQLVRIHPVILVTVLKPLNVLGLSSTSFQDALQYQALYTGEMNLMKWVLRQEDVCNYFEVQENGALLLTKMDVDGEQKPCFASTNISFAKPNGVYETHFTTVEEPAQTTGILVYCRPAYPRCAGVSKAGLLNCKSETFQLLIYRTDGIERRDKRVTPPCLKKGDKIRVVVDMVKRQCTFRINGVELVLENLREEVHLAAFCWPSGKLRVVLVSDNTFL